jgi:hypothetical protein
LWRRLEADSEPVKFGKIAKDVAKKIGKRFLDFPFLFA